jgi:flagellar biosynthesis protein FlhG
MSPHTSEPPSAPAFAVVSGKGGVGKSVVAVNLAEALAARGERVALLDADAGQGACALLLNEAPAACVRQWATGRAALDDVLHRTATGLTLVQAAAEPDPSEPDAAFYAALDRVLAHLRQEHDVVLIDTPAGVGGPVRWALERAGHGLLVLLGEPTAVADAYRLTKLLWQADPAFPLNLVVNAADTEGEAASVAERFGDVTERFLGARPDTLGWVPYAAAMRQAVRQQTPAVRAGGAMAHAFGALADALFRQPA